MLLLQYVNLKIIYLAARMLFRQTCYSLAKPLAVLFTQLMSVSAVPGAWKMAIVTPVFKKGLATDVVNYIGQFP